MQNISASKNPSRMTATTVPAVMFLAIFIGLAWSPARAESASTDETQAAAQLEPMVVTARGSARPVSLTAGGVGVITAEEIERLQCETVSDILRHIPGLEKISDSPWGPEMSIRGLGRNSIVFLVDGCRVNTATDINAQFGLINPGDIERIEVLKGPISALYGSGSIGGVVNIITKKGHFTAEPDVNGEVAWRYADNPRGMETYANVAGQGPRLSLFASGAYRDYDDRVAGGGDTIANSQFRDQHLKVAGAWRWSGTQTTDLQAQYAEGYDIGIPGKGLSLPVGPDVTYPRVSRSLLDLVHTVTPETGLLRSSEVKVYLQEIQRRVRIDNFPAGSPAVKNEPSADHQTAGFKWTNQIEWEDHAAVVGIDIWRWKIDNTERVKTLASGAVGVDSSLGNVSQETYGLFAEEDWQATQRLALNLGARVDAVKSECDTLYNWIKPPGAAIVPTLKRLGETNNDMSWQAHAGLTWQAAEDWSVTLLAASSYRVPDVMDRYKYINLGGGVELYGNPDLDPERSVFLETGLHWSTGQWRVSASVYANFLKDLITEKYLSTTVIQLANVDRANIFGSELEGSWRFHPDWEAFGDIAWTEGRNETLDEPLAFIAPLNGRLGLGYRPGSKDGFWAEAELEWAATQDSVPAGVAETPSWETLNLRAGYRFSALGLSHAVSAEVTNIFDATYRNHLSTSRGIELKEAGIGAACQWKVAF